MRPLARPQWRAEWDGARPSDVALHALGRFCAACERRLPQAAVAWHAARQEPLDERLTAEDWAETIPLCHNCAYAASRSGTGAPDVLFPHRDVTFTLAEDSPLRYERVGGDTGERVMVLPSGGQGENTASYFALNGHVPALDGDFPLQPDADLLTRDWIDPRMELRTRAWDAASTAAVQLSAVPSELRGVVLDLVGTLASDTGFWSTWATVLWRETRDREALERILQSPVAGPDALPPIEAPAPHAFPATRPGWLPPPEVAAGA